MANSKDVAALAGTSQTTVSRVFRGAPGVRPETVRRVYEAAAKLKYEPSEAARALTSGRTRRIALVVESLTHPVFALIADLVHQALVEQDYRAHIIESDSPRGELQEFSLNAFTGVDGVIFCSASRDFDSAGLLRQVDQPVVFSLRVGYPLADESPADAVVPDHEMGAELAVAHLWDAGHRRIALLGATSKYTAGYETRQAFIHAMERRGESVEDLLISTTGMGYDGSLRDAAVMLTAEQNPPTAFFTPDDQSAYGAVDAVRELGLSVPHDVSVVGFDDLPISAWKAYDLTTIKIPYPRLVELTIQRLMSRIETPDEEPPKPVFDVLPVELVRRQSTGPPKNTTPTAVSLFPIT